MKKLFRWSMFSVGCILAVGIYAVWKEYDQHHGGGFISGFLRGVLIFGGLAFLWAWAKNSDGQKKDEIDKVVKGKQPTSTYRVNAMQTCTFGRQLLLFILLLVYLPSTVFALNVNPTSLKGMAQAYGFVLGQEYSLARIAKEIPELIGGVELARAQFDSTFPDIKTKLEKQLKQAMGEKLFQETAASLRMKLRETLGRQQITSDIAASFLGQVKARSKGEIESPVLEYLLAVKYTANPVGEFADGFRQRYQTDGAGKSQGIKLTLQLPRSWASKEGERPHIVQKWQSENGTGMEMIAIEIHDAQGYSSTKKEMEEFVRSGEVKDTVPEGSTYIAAGNFNLEMQTGYWMQVAMSGDRAGWKFYQDYLMYQLFFRGKAIGVTCAAVGPESEKLKVNEAFKRVRPLCQQVLNSLVLAQAY